MFKDHTYYVYILTNPSRTVLYVGMTNTMKIRLQQHIDGCNSPTSKSFTSRYQCYELVYFEIYQYVTESIARENQLKKWSRKKKENLINTTNPNWQSLNIQFLYTED